MSATITRCDAVDLDEVEWLLDGGESPWQVAHRIGRSAASIERAARRRGRLRLAAIFCRERDWTRRHAA